MPISGERGRLTIADYLYRVLEQPSVYRAVQRALAPGAEAGFAVHLRRMVARLPAAQRVLDVGCGPSSVLWAVGLRPIGLDLLTSYTASFAANHEPAVTASASALPFPHDSMDAVWSIGLLHHLPDEVARRAIREMVRVTRPGGAVVLFDGVLPRTTWQRPHIWLQRRLDRGRHMRSGQALKALLPEPDRWYCHRVSYSTIGHEGLFCSLTRL